LKTPLTHWTFAQPYGDGLDGFEYRKIQRLGATAQLHIVAVKSYVVLAVLDVLAEAFERLQYRKSDLFHPLRCLGEVSA
jgi:hypothetical protein